MRAKPRGYRQSHADAPGTGAQNTARTFLGPRALSLLWPHPGRSRAHLRSSAHPLPSPRPAHSPSRREMRYVTAPLNVFANNDPPGTTGKDHGRLCEAHEEVQNMNSELEGLNVPDAGCGTEERAGRGQGHVHHGRAHFKHPPSTSLHTWTRHENNSNLEGFCAIVARVYKASDTQDLGSMVEEEKRARQCGTSTTISTSVDLLQDHDMDDIDDTYAADLVQRPASTRAISTPSRRTTRRGRTSSASRARNRDEGTDTD